MRNRGAAAAAERIHREMVTAAFSGISQRRRLLSPKFMWGRRTFERTIRASARWLLRIIGWLGPWIASHCVPLVAILAVKGHPEVEGSTVSDLAEVIRSHEIATDVLVYRFPSDSDAKKMLGQVADLPEILRVAGVLWLNARMSSSEIARVVFEVFVLDGIAASGDARVEVALALVRRGAPALPESQAIQLIMPLWRLASAPSDPYSPAGHRAGASTALMELIATRRDITESVVQFVAGRPIKDRSLALNIVARSVRAMGPTSSESFREFVRLLKLDGSELKRFSETSDLKTRTSPEAYQTNSVPSIASHHVTTIVRLLLVMHPVVIIGLALFFGERGVAFASVLDLDSVPLEIGVALIALIATIHVFTVQFASARLPAAVARVAGEPWQLWGGYISAISLVAAIILDRNPVESGFWAAVEVLLLLDFVGWLGSALSGTFHRTGAAEACRVYTRRHLSKWVRAGRRHGAFQARANELRRVVDPLPFAGTAGQRELLGFDLTRIEAAERGVFLPSPVRLSRFLAHSIFAGPGYLQFSSGFGLIVPQAGQLAIVRANDGRLPMHFERRLARVLQPISAKDIEDVSSDAIALAALALGISSSGDLRLAEEIAEDSAQIVVSHLLAVQHSRARAAALRLVDTEDGAVVYPVTPALRDILDFLIRRVLEQETLWRTADVVIKRCLSVSLRGDHAATILTSLIVSAGESFPPSPAAEWLRHAGINALRCDDDFAFESVTRRLREIATRFTGESNASRALVSLCAASLRLRPERFDGAWGEIVLWLQGVGIHETASRVSLQVGAAALDCGGYRAVAICARQAATDERYAALLEQTSLERVRAEASLAELSGLDVGDVPTDRMEQFRDFVSTIRKLGIS